VAAAAISLAPWSPDALAQPPAPSTKSFELAAPAEVVATISARCDRCAWDVAGREAVVLRITLDGRYVAHLPLVRGGIADYPVMIGRVAPGRHSLQVAPDLELTAGELKADGSSTVERISVANVEAGSREHTAVSLAPFVHARPNTLGRFTDAPVFMWYEREPTARGVRYRYSVVFTNEDGGTPADRLMATWGRTTDIEYVYSVEVDHAGSVLHDDLQGRNHEILRFGGTREDRHPLLWVVTDNNMVADAGTTRVRYAPAPVFFALENVSREAVMDANPWLYSVAAQELAREGKIVENTPPGRGAIPDPRRFVYVEACGDLGGAAIAFEVGVRDTWERSDRGVPSYKIGRDGCFRGAVPVSASVRSGDVRGVRIVASPRPSSDGGQRPTRGSVRIDRINKVFMLDDHHRPGAALIQWSGPAIVKVGGPALEVLVQ
jgi:hypothetical protein